MSESEQLTQSEEEIPPVSTIYTASEPAENADPASEPGQETPQVFHIIGFRKSWEADDVTYDYMLADAKNNIHTHTIPISLNAQLFEPLSIEVDKTGVVSKIIPWPTNKTRVEIINDFFEIIKNPQVEGTVKSIKGDGILRLSTSTGEVTVFGHKLVDLMGIKKGYHVKAFGDLVEKNGIKQCDATIIVGREYLKKPECPAHEPDPKVIIQEETNTNAIEVDRLEDIKMPKIDEIAPISFDGLPKYNLVCMLKDYVASYSDPYPEYCFQNGIAMLSTLTRRRLKMGINGREEFTNVWTLSLGQSGYARKGGMWKFQTMLKEAVGDSLLPHDATPEGLIDIMADLIETTAYDKKAGVQVKKVEFDSRDYPGKIRKAVCSLWKDEAGQFYAELNKTHKQSQKEFLCTLFDCTANYEKKLSGKYFIIRDTFYGMNLATTPAAFKEHCIGRDVHTGFIARHNIVSPTYKKKRKEITENKDEDTVIENGFVEMIKAIDRLIPKECLRVRIGQKNINILEEWAARGEEYFRNRNDDMMGSFFARFQISVLKIAILLELGNLPYYLTDYLLHREDSVLINSETVEINIGELNKSTPVDNNKIGELLQNHPLIRNYEISSISISTSTLLYVIDLFNKMYIPYTHKLCEDLIVSKKFSNVRDVEMIIKEKGLIDRKSLLKKSKMHTDELDKALDTLFTSETAIEYQVKGKTKPATWYLYNPSNYTTFDFSIANVDKIPREDYSIVLTKKKRKPSAVIEAYYICQYQPKKKIPCADPAKCSTCNHYPAIMPTPG